MPLGSEVRIALAPTNLGVESFPASQYKKARKSLLKAAILQNKDENFAMGYSQYGSDIARAGIKRRLNLVGRC